MYNYLGNSTLTTLRFLPDYTPIKINVTLLYLTFVKRSQIVVIILNHSPELPRNASKYRDNRPFYTLVSEFCRCTRKVS